MQDYEQKNALIFGASFDTVEDNAAFAKKFDFPFPLLCDIERDIGLKYGACDSPDADAAKRITYVIDPEGKVSQVHPKVNPSKHAAELLESL